MAKHAKLSPSAADRWMVCPGSVLLSEGIEDPSSAYADEGTAAHYLAATCLGEEKNAIDFVGGFVYLIVDNRDGSHFESFYNHLEEAHCKVLAVIEVTDEMAEFVQVYLDYVRDVVNSTEGKLFVEQSVPLTHITYEKDAFGTSDTIILTENEVIVIDLKFGRGVSVSAEKNKQMLMYASGAVERFSLVHDPKRVRLAICQPRVSRAPSEWDCSIDELRAFEDEVRKAAMLVGSDTLVPSEKGCLWCKAKGSCEALANWVQDALGADFENLVLEGAPKVEADTSLPLKMACLDTIEDWCRAVRGKVESELIAGRPVAGYKLVQGRQGARVWSNSSDVEAMMKSMCLKVDEMYDFKIISPTSAEKVLKEHPKKWEKLQPLITRSEGKVSVAPESDKRPAVVLAPSADNFDVVK